MLSNEPIWSVNKSIQLLYVPPLVLHRCREIYSAISKKKRSEKSIYLRCVWNLITDTRQILNIVQRCSSADSDVLRGIFKRIRKIPRCVQVRLVTRMLHRLKRRPELLTIAKTGIQIDNDKPPFERSIDAFTRFDNQWLFLLPKDCNHH